MRFLNVVQLLHNVQALPDSSDKLGPVSVTSQTKRCPKLQKPVSIPEVILQSTFPRTAISLSKQKRMNFTAVTPQQVTLKTKRVVHFIAESLLYLCGANSATTYLSPVPVTY